MFNRKLLSAVALAAVSLTAAAADKTQGLKPYAGELPASLQAVKTAGSLDVFTKFPAAGGLDGWVVQDRNSGKNIIIYTTKDGEVTIAGMLLDKLGKNLSAVYAEQHIPAPDYTEAYSDFKKAPGVVVGSAKAKAEAIVVVDANCGYCKLMHKLLEPAVKSGELKVRYVPVGILSADSDTKGAGLLAAKDPLAAMDAAAAGPAAQSTDKALVEKVRANTALMKQHGFNGTPAVLYYSAKAKGQDATVNVANGVPNITEMFSKLGINGDIDQLKKDPQLARFVR